MQKPRISHGRIGELLSPLFAAVSAAPAEQNTLEQLATLTTGYTLAQEQEQQEQEQSYYDYPVLKQPFWRWEIIWYFFLGGLAAGSYIVASIASLFGSENDRVVRRTGYYLSLLALLPCPALLIKDLGRPERFLNMMRIFKFRSPMSMGVWGLLSFSTFSSITAIVQAARDGLLGRWWGARLIASLPLKLLAIPGSFFSAFLGGYTGVLLTATSVPLWSRSKLLGGIFVTSAISTGTALISLVLRLSNAPTRTLHKLERLEWTAMLVEIVGLLAFLRQSGRVARPLVGTGPNEHGKVFWRFMFGGGLLLPWLMQTAALFNSKRSKSASRNIFVPLLVLVGGYFLRRTMIEAGHSSSKDARTTLWNARR